MRLSVLIVFFISIFSFKVTGQTSVGAFVTLGAGGIGGYGVTGFKLFKAPGPGIGLAVRHQFSNGLFVVAEPALRNIRIAETYEFTSMTSAVGTSYKGLYMHIFNNISIPVYAGMYLLNSGTFRPWLGLGASFENTTERMYREGSPGNSKSSIRHQHILATNYLGFDLVAGKATLSLLAAYTPYLFMSKKFSTADDDELNSPLTGTKQLGISANYVRLSCNIQVGKESQGLLLTPALEALSRPTYLLDGKTMPYFGYLALRFGVMKTL